MAGESRPESAARLYLSRQARSLARYFIEQTLFLLVGWIPALPGIAIRALLYRAILRMDGLAAIENNVRLRFASEIRLGHGAYLDHGVYLHACPNGRSSTCTTPAICPTRASGLGATA
jgi:hypothetical protein